MVKIQLIMVVDIQVKVTPVTVIQVTPVVMVAIKDMVDTMVVAMVIHMVNSIVIVNPQQENLLTNILPLPEKILNTIIKTQLNLRTLMLTEELLFQMFNNHLLLLQLTLRECL
jgi:ribosomal protein L3